MHLSQLLVTSAKHNHQHSRSAALMLPCTYHSRVQDPALKLHTHTTYMYLHKYCQAIDALTMQHWIVSDLNTMPVQQPQANGVPHLSMLSILLVSLRVG